MPTYDYACTKCDHRWELFQSITAAPVRKCPNCGKYSAKRIIGPGAGIIFRGSGFYQTDYRSEAYKKAAAADQKSNAPADKGDSKSGDSSAKGSGTAKPEGTSSD